MIVMEDCKKDSILILFLINIRHNIVHIKYLITLVPKERGIK